MVSIITNSIRINSAEQMLESVSESDSTSLYIAYGKNTPWSANDASPNVALDTIKDKYEVWRNLIYGKKVTGNDVSLVIPRLDWQANVAYTQYDDTSNTLFSTNSKMYVLTDENKVYKCLFNNNGANSTIKPTYTLFGTTSIEADGYVWKYMYSLNTKDIQRFLSSLWMPVKTLSLDDGSAQWGVQSAAIDGALDIILVTNTGIGYTNTSNISVIITGDGSGANAIAFVNTISNTIANVVVTSRGSGYSFANVTFQSSSGTGGQGRAIIPPYGGHGKDPVYELGGSNLMIDVLFRGSENNLILANNDFRQISIIKDPLDYTTSNVYSNTFFNQTLTLTLAGAGADYVQDEIVYQGSSKATSTFSGRVLSWNSATNVMQLTEYTGTPSSVGLNGDSSGANKYIVSASQPNLKARSGQVIFIDNIQSITRSSDQIDNFKVVIKY